ncbi:hypothetical protein OIU34_20880 [Pararhizobium sp. BT-229]|uniref:hypothetical protein n=1 Tax=Pararhizobium sp. BT-229 TaxID=2986923 RepID=UPI0021F6B900|nr:hypothetical protein [Pararhizobium sp. BT-229]MCV9964346.1 hypothetical protein [Pararhizobium sp. BT-229]
MSAFTTQELAEHASLNTDGMAGFEAQVALKSYKREVVWPEHLRGKREDDFRYGSELARTWMAMRRGVGIFRRKYRQRELKEIGIMTVLSACNAPDLKAEQIETLKEAVERIRLVKARVAEASPSEAPTD